MGVQGCFVSPLLVENVLVWVVLLSKIDVGQTSVVLCSGHVGQMPGEIMEFLLLTRLDGDMKQNGNHVRSPFHNTGLVSLPARVSQSRLVCRLPLFARPMLERPWPIA